MEKNHNFYPGLVALFGSGETLPSSSKIHEFTASQVADKLRIVVLETPAGFQPNSAGVAREVADFIAQRLQNYKPAISVVPARKKGTRFSPDNPQLLTPLLEANWIFLGPGSPTYASQQLQDSLAYHLLVARHRLGASVTLASAGALAISAQVLPVYEIYKVGAELHWQKGLDFFGAYGLPLVFIPHWNNTDGGVKLDTSRCYLGKERFSQLIELLPPLLTIVGLDEHTSLVIDLASQSCRVMGNGGITILRETQQQYYERGSVFSIRVLGEFHMPEVLDGLPAQVWQNVLEHKQEKMRQADRIPDKVIALVEERLRARQQKDWGRSDLLRDQISALGWEVRDTKQGVELVKKESGSN